MQLVFRVASASRRALPFLLSIVLILRSTLLLRRLVILFLTLFVCIVTLPLLLIAVILLFLLFYDRKGMAIDVSLLEGIPHCKAFVSIVLGPLLVLLKHVGQVFWLDNEQSDACSGYPPVDYKVVSTLFGNSFEQKPTFACLDCPATVSVSAVFHEELDPPIGISFQCSVSGGKSKPHVKALFKDCLLRNLVLRKSTPNSVKLDPLRAGDVCNHPVKSFS
mmetsp:Transcript_6312/g.12494  ORF Transcript_6312/g.12494 Transcript_6312/m.12494 type:complete len:220 (+) Transcript_6312:292-951(+)